MPDKQSVPSFTIDADDPHFVPVLQHLVMFVGARIGMPEDQRAERLAALDALIQRARVYQQEQGTRKPALDRKRHWATVKD
jgi:hypothetical protein